MNTSEVRADLLGAASNARRVPIDFLANCGVAERHMAEVYDDFRADQDVPPETPWTAEEFEAFEAWISEFYDELGLDEYEVYQREMDGPHEERRLPKPLASPCGDADEDWPL